MQLDDIDEVYVYYWPGSIAANDFVQATQLCNT